MKQKIFFKMCLIIIAVSNLLAPAFAQIKSISQKQDTIAPQKFNAMRNRRAPSKEEKNYLNVKNNPAFTASGLPNKNQRSDKFCEVFFDNGTEWIVKLYINGIYRGAIGGYDDATIYVEQGEFTVYTRADFTDGTFKYWGPKKFTCVPNSYPALRIGLTDLERKSGRLPD